MYTQPQNGYVVPEMVTCIHSLKMVMLCQRSGNMYTQPQNGYVVPEIVTCIHSLKMVMLCQRL